MPVEPLLLPVPPVPPGDDCAIATPVLPSAEMSAAISSFFIECLRDELVNGVYEKYCPRLPGFLAPRWRPLEIGVLRSSPARCIN